MSGDPLIELIDVEVLDEATGRPLVRGVNWRAVRGEFWVIGGAPGCGKSAWLATAAGLNRPGRGTLRLFGNDLAIASERTQIACRRRLGFVFAHGGRLFNQLTVADNIALPLLYHEDGAPAEWPARVAAALTRAELTAVAHLKPSRLTARLRQRVALMRALIIPTEVLLLDEPLVGAGRHGEEWWLDVLGEQQQTGVTVVVATDDFRPWRAVANRWAVIQGEQLLASDPAGVPE